MIRERRPMFNILPTSSSSTTSKLASQAKRLAALGNSQRPSKLGSVGIAELWFAPALMCIISWQRSAPFNDERFGVLVSALAR